MPLMRGGGIESSLKTNSAVGSGHQAGGALGGASRGGSASRGRRGRLGGRSGGSYLFGSRITGSSGRGGGCPGAASADSCGAPSTIFSKKPGRPRGSRGSRSGLQAVGTRRVGGVPVDSNIKRRPLTAAELLKMRNSARGMKRPHDVTTVGGSEEGELPSMPIVSQEEEEVEDGGGSRAVSETGWVGGPPEVSAQEESGGKGGETKKAVAASPSPGTRTKGSARGESGTGRARPTKIAASSARGAAASTALPSTSQLCHPKPRLAYSSATNKPVCLCIIWVHLQASSTCDGVLAKARRHQCMVKKAPDPVSRGNHIVCNYCRCGYSSYPLYLDHLHSSQCGHRQRRNNKPHAPAAVVLPPLELPGHPQTLREFMAEKKKRESQVGEGAAATTGATATTTASATTIASSPSGTLPATSSSSHHPSAPLELATSDEPLSEDSPALSLERAARQICSQVGAGSAFGRGTAAAGRTALSPLGRSAAAKRRRYNNNNGGGGLLPAAGSPYDWQSSDRQSKMHPAASFSQHMMQQQHQLQQAGISKPYFQHHIHSQQQPHHPLHHHHQRLLHQHQLHQQRLRHHQHWQQQHHLHSRMYPAGPHQVGYPPPVSPAGYGYPGLYGGGHAHPGWSGVPHHPLQHGQWPLPGPHQQQPWPHHAGRGPYPPPAPQQSPHNPPPQHQEVTGLQNYQQGYYPNSAQGWDQQGYGQQQQQWPQQQYLNNQQWPRNHHHHQHHHQQQQVQQQAAQGDRAGGSSFHPNHLQGNLYLQPPGGQYQGSGGDQQLNQAQSGGTLQQQQQPQQLLGHPEPHHNLAPGSDLTDLDQPPRPSSDDDVIRAAAEVVARENGTLPVFSQAFQDAPGGVGHQAVQEELATGGHELFVEDGVSNEVVVTNDLTSDEVATLAGFSNITSLNNLVSFVSETCLSDKPRNPAHPCGGAPAAGSSPTSSTTETAHSEDLQEPDNGGRAGQQGPFRDGSGGGGDVVDLQDCFLKEGSQDPVLTATAQVAIPSRMVMDNDASGRSEHVPREARQHHQQQPPPSAGLEVVVTEKALEFGSCAGEETITLHYALDEPNPTYVLAGGEQQPVVAQDDADDANNNGSSGSSNGGTTGYVGGDMGKARGTPQTSSSPAASFPPAADSNTTTTTSTSSILDEGDLVGEGQCPHAAAADPDLPPVSAAEQARDQLKLITMQAQLGYVLVGLLGEKRLAKFGFPGRSVISILHTILELTKTKVLEEDHNCTPECAGKASSPSLEQAENQQQQRDEDEDGGYGRQLTCRLLQRRIKVLMVNIAKLLCICVPVRHKWREFGWDGKGVEEILEQLSKVEIPKFHPGDPEYEIKLREMEEEEQERHQRAAGESAGADVIGEDPGGLDAMAVDDCDGDVIAANEEVILAVIDDGAGGSGAAGADRMVEEAAKTFERMEEEGIGEDDGERFPNGDGASNRDFSGEGQSLQGDDTAEATPEATPRQGPGGGQIFDDASNGDGGKEAEREGEAEVTGAGEGALDGGPLLTSDDSQHVGDDNEEEEEEEVEPPAVAVASASSSGSSSRSPSYNVDPSK